MKAKFTQVKFLAVGEACGAIYLKREHLIALGYLQGKLLRPWYPTARATRGESVQPQITCTEFDKKLEVFSHRKLFKKIIKNEVVGTRIKEVCAMPLILETSVV